MLDVLGNAVGVNEYQRARATIATFFYAAMLSNGHGSPESAITKAEKMLEALGVADPDKQAKLGAGEA